ncbi:MAG: hypothetical protein ACI9NT_001749 [Bacteroidia bacterium]|jgi:hypothetical protein
MQPEIQPSTVPTACENWITVTEVADGAFFVDELFQRKYRQIPPDFGRHIVAFYRDRNGAFQTLSYLHFWRQERIGLIGGGCTDGEVMRSMEPEHARIISEEGGVLRQTLLYAFTRFHNEIDAFFGHAGDHRARQVDLAAGFLETSDEHLLIRPVRPLSTEEEAALFAQAKALGNF